MFKRTWLLCWEYTIGEQGKNREACWEAITVIQMRDDNGLDQMAALALDCIVYTGQEGVGRVRLKEWEGTGPSFVMKANNVHARCKTNERTVISGCNLRLKILNAKSLRLMPQINCGCEWLKARPRKEGKQGKIRNQWFLGLWQKLEAVMQQQMILENDHSK